MKLFYLSWGETPRMSGVYKSQIINLLARFPIEIDIDLICGLPIINSGLTREKHRYFNVIRSIKKKIMDE